MYFAHTRKLNDFVVNVDKKNTFLGYVGFRSTLLVSSCIRNDLRAFMENVFYFVSTRAHADVVPGWRVIDGELSLS